MIQLNEKLYLIPYPFKSAGEYWNHGWITDVSGQFRLESEEIREGQQLCHKSGYFVEGTENKLTEFGKAMLKLTQ